MTLVLRLAGAPIEALDLIGRTALGGSLLTATRRESLEAGRHRQQIIIPRRPL